MSNTHDALASLAGTARQAHEAYVDGDTLAAAEFMGNMRVELDALLCEACGGYGTIVSAVYDKQGRQSRKFTHCPTCEGSGFDLSKGGK